MIPIHKINEITEQLSEISLNLYTMYLEFKNENKHEWIFVSKHFASLSNMIDEVQELIQNSAK